MGYLTRTEKIAMAVVSFIVAFAISCLLAYFLERLIWSLLFLGLYMLSATDIANDLMCPRDADKEPYSFWNAVATGLSWLLVILLAGYLRREIRRREECAKASGTSWQALRCLP